MLTVTVNDFALHCYAARLDAQERDIHHHIRRGTALRFPSVQLGSGRGDVAQRVMMFNDRHRVRLSQVLSAAARCFGQSEFCGVSVLT